jgi:hypothetical protein
LAIVSGISIFGYPFGIVPDIGDVSGLSIFCYSFDIVPYGQFRDIANIRHKTQNEKSKTVCTTYKTKTMSSTYPANQAKQNTELLFFI